MPILPVYVTRPVLEEVGLPITSWSASRVNRLILSIGSFIDRLTGQRFIAYGEDFKMSGEDRPLIERPDRLPILSVSDIVIDATKTTRIGMVFQGGLDDQAIPRPGLIDGLSYVLGGTYTFPSGSYVLKPFHLPRYIESVQGLFPGGSNNVTVTGVFGWPELTSVKATPFSTTTTADITTTSTTIALTSVTGLKLRDVLIVGGYPFIVQAISSLNVTIDAPTGILTSSIPSGSTAVAYAAVPYDIERAATFLAVREYSRQAQWADGNFVDPTLIAGEKTDKYEYKVFAPAQTIGFGKAPGLTSVPEIDEILTAYTAPVSVEFA